VLYVPPDSLLFFTPPVQDTTVILRASSSEGGAAPAVESKLKRWTGTAWVTVGTLVIFN
jgi:hypothetical protein